MKWIKYTSRKETYASVLLWTMILVVPLVGMVAFTSFDSNYGFSWVFVWHIWRPLLVILLAFLIHNYFIAPELVYKRNRGKYAALLLVLFMAFLAYQCTSVPPAKPPMRGGEGMPPELRAERLDRHSTGHVPRPFASPHDFTMFMLLAFALGANLGIKLYFKMQDDQQRGTELERENLRQELNYLRYQVNPHFLMNTLNNIHALVDINPAEAKSSIIGLSKFMRYLLYESDTERISLQQAIDLTRQYIDLMSKRCADKVDIRFDVPDQIPNVGLAPLVLIPFIENAFKHGVSYDRPSYIHVALLVDNGEIVFTCVNSKNGIQHEVGGIGLANVVKRLDLIYGDRYTLEIDDNGKYFVMLAVPAENVS